MEPAGGHISWGYVCGLHSQKHTQEQTVGGFCHDLSPWLGSLWVDRGHVAISAEASTWIAGPIHKGEGVHVSVYVFLWAQAWGKGVSGEMNQPLSSATRPLTYRARFIET